jgi:hypothetical protein
MHTQERAAHVPLCGLLLKKEDAHIHTDVSHDVKYSTYRVLRCNFSEKNGKQLNVKWERSRVLNGKDSAFRCE